MYMKTVRRSLLAVTLALAAGLPLSAAAASLSVGDPAPKLQTGKFVQGDPVKEFASGKAYIVEFWATWCPPCRASIPHLNETYTKFKDKRLIVIGQDCWEQDESKVAPFVQTMGEKMTYRVALDDKQGSEKGKMAETWMQAAGQNGIPTAFLIDTTGHIAWIGHPMAMQEKTIEAVLAGNYNAKEAAAAEEKQNALLESIGRKLQAAMGDKDWDAALKNLDELAKVAPAGAADYLSNMRFKILAGKKDYPAAFKIIRQMADAHKDNPMQQNTLAWMIVSDKSIEHPDLDLAQTLAQRATDGAKESSEKSQSMDTLARVKFMKGSKDEAIALQQKAVALAADNEKDKLQKTLDSYKKGQLPDVD
jgi:thiol-disulfide isomerase/thioredoxin